MLTRTPDPCHYQLTVSAQIPLSATDTLTACMSCMSPNPATMPNILSFNVLLGCRCRGSAATPKAYTAGCRKSEQNTGCGSANNVGEVVGLLGSPHGNAQTPNGLHFVAGRLAGADPVAIIYFARTLIPASLQLGAELLS